ncbi:hypothetical protein SS1G_13538 [Sclerotinia sclerotiorum 1980 UF-70]|uniref:Uncharacterized protein n=1 Tax=Sclerotinia sclerotiorum (strain ATCC 18683 / 1980 / Ss-1) TaxID=665079 RepID=A7F7F8_SCLS1|nr:hypothetical protein SS1G_13538 [Sclerotinia sclerotiorum 1980 UF-70]EDN98679.1 hypothetical protein SS1G_13538 [Sclerotinia sclerotiorum 1980 UF-70]
MREKIRLLELKMIDILVNDAFFEVVETFIRTLPTLVDAGGVSVWLLTNSSFAMTPTSGVWPAKSELDEIMRPTIMKLEEDYVTHRAISETQSPR